MAEINDELLTEDQAAQLLGIKPQTLSVWRCQKRYDLAYIKLGRLIRYRRSACERFLESRTVRQADTPAA
jgi:predicted DNA-binding transcriptional regulator AlpA